MSQLPVTPPAIGLAFGCRSESLSATIVSPIAAASVTERVRRGAHGYERSHKHEIEHQDSGETVHAGHAQMMTAGAR